MKELIDDEFRMIIGHALLGCDTSEVDKETWDLVFSECTKYLNKEVEKEREKATPLIEALEHLIAGVGNLPPLTAIEGVLVPHCKKAKEAIKTYKHG